MDCLNLSVDYRFGGCYKASCERIWQCPLNHQGLSQHFATSTLATGLQKHSLGGVNRTLSVRSIVNDNTASADVRFVAVYGSHQKRRRRSDTCCQWRWILVIHVMQTRRRETGGFPSGSWCVHPPAQGRYYSGTQHNHREFWSRSLWASETEQVRLLQECGY